MFVKKRHGTQQFLNCSQFLFLLGGLNWVANCSPILSSRSRARGSGIDEEFGINKYMLLSTKEATSKDLLYSKGNSTQHFVATYKGKEPGGKIYIYMGLPRWLRW